MEGGSGHIILGFKIPEKENLKHSHTWTLDFKTVCCNNFRDIVDGSMEINFWFKETIGELGTFQNKILELQLHPILMRWHLGTIVDA